MREFVTIPEKILDRALYLAGQHGSLQIPVREITRAAGVNVNAVNYYFGTKEEMQRQVKALFIRNYLAAYAVLDDLSLGEEARLVAWSDEMMEYTLRYPGIQLILKHILDADRSCPTRQFLADRSALCHQKAGRLLARVLGVEESAAELCRIIYNSAILHPVSVGTGVRFDTEQMRDRPFRLTYIHTLLAILKKGIQP